MKLEINLAGTVPFAQLLTGFKCVILEKQLHSSIRDFCPYQPTDGTISRRNTDFRTSTCHPEAQIHPHLIHLLLTNSSDNSAELGINFLITHSYRASVKTKTFLSPCCLTFSFKSKTIRNCCDLLANPGLFSKLGAAQSTAQEGFKHKKLASYRFNLNKPGRLN